MHVSSVQVVMMQVFQGQVELVMHLLSDPIMTQTS